jgi:hypothetical protein
VAGCYEHFNDHIRRNFLTSWPTIRSLKLICSMMLTSWYVFNGIQIQICKVYSVLTSVWISFLWVCIQGPKTICEVNEMFRLLSLSDPWLFRELGRKMFQIYSFLRDWKYPHCNSLDQNILHLVTARARVWRMRLRNYFQNVCKTPSPSLPHAYHISQGSTANDLSGVHSENVLKDRR